MRFIFISLALAVVFSACGRSENKKPMMPVQITLRESVMGKGYVVQFNNTSNKYLKIKVLYKNGTLRRSKKSYIELPPNGMVETGWLQGWKFASSETITLSHEDYQTMFYKIP